MKTLLLFLLFSASALPQAYMRVYRVADLPPASLMNAQSAMVSDGGGPVDCTVGGGLYFVICTSNGTTYASRTIGSPGSGNVNTTGNMVNGNVPISTGNTTIADGGQVYPAGPFADTNSTQSFINKDLSSSTNIFPSSIPRLGNNNVFTGLNTFRTVAGTSDIIISTGASGQQSFVRFDDLGTEKWAIGKNSDNSFFVFDAANNRLTMNTDNFGNLSIGVPTTLSPVNSGLSNSQPLIMASRNSGGTLLQNQIYADSDGSINWKSVISGGGDFNFLPLGTTNQPSPGLQLFSYSSGGSVNIAKTYEDPNGNVQALAGATAAGFNWYTSAGTFLATLQSNGNFSSAACLQVGTLGASWCQGSGSPSSTPSPGSLYSRTDTGQVYTYTGGQWSSNQLGCANILNFGGNNSGSVSNNSAWSNILSISGTQACVYFPGPGNYLFATSPAWTAGSSNSAIMVKGDGANVSNLVFSAGGMIFNGSHTGDSVHVQDLSLATSTAGSATGISLHNSGAQNGFAASSIINVNLFGADGYAATDYWASAITASAWSEVSMDHINIVGSSTGGGTGGLGVGINLTPVGSVNGVVYTLHDVKHSYGAIGVQIGDLIQGITINQSNFTAVNTGVLGLAGSAYGDDDQLIISNSQFSSKICGIDIESPIRHTNIHDNYFVVPGTACAGTFNNYAMTNVHDNQAINVGGGGGNGFIFGTYANDASQVIANQTQFFATGIWLQAASAHTSAYANQGTSNTNNLINSGTGNPASVTFTGASTGSFQVQDGYVIHQ